MGRCGRALWPDVLGILVCHSGPYVAIKCGLKFSWFLLHRLVRVLLAAPVTRAAVGLSSPRKGSLLCGVSLHFSAFHVFLCLQPSKVVSGLP